MLFGDKRSFAVECELGEEINTFQFCQFRFWIQGEPIGNWDEKVVLGVLLHSAKIYLDTELPHLEKDADSMTAQELFRRYYDAAYSSDPNIWQETVEKQYRQRFHLEEIGADSISATYCILAIDRTDGLERVIWRHRSESELHEALIQPGLIVSVLREFVIRMS